MIRKRVRPGIRGRWARLAALMPVGALLAVFVMSSPASALIGGPIRGYQGMCLDLSGNLIRPGQPIDLYPCNNSGAQNWFQQNGSSNLIQLEEYPAMCVDLYHNINADGASIVLWPCSNTDPAEQWVPAPGGNLVNPGTNKTIDDPGWSAVPGTNLELWDRNGGANQDWTLAGQ